MGFFDRNRRELEQRGIDPRRLPPGQYSTDRFPVLHAGSVPRYDDLSTWDLRVFGAVEREVTLSWDELRAMPAVDLTTDIHCVTKWSKFDTVWTGVAVDALLALASPLPSATHVLWHSEHGFTANVPLADVSDTPGAGAGAGDGGSRPKAIVAYAFGGQPLEPDHGYPLRSLVPHLYFWKSAKWLRGIELMTEDRPGFWERNGYHMYGDPFLEQRHWGD